MAINLLASRSDPPLAALVVANMVRSSVCVSVKWGTRNALELPGATIDSPLNICRYLARTLQNDFYGSDPLQRTEIDHWLIFSTGPLSSNGEFSSAVEYLNQVLGPATYLVGNQLSLADVYVWSTLHKSSNWINLSQTSKALVNATRWYNFISSLDVVTALMSSLPDVVSTAISALSVTEKGNKDTTKPKDEGKFVELPGAEKGKVVVRFPPEASGYLHIGHAKAALLNQYYKDAYEGKLIMRFDDTNPAKEKVDFEKVILEDLELLKLTPDSYTHTSNYFELMLELCEKLLHQGLAYADDTDAETMKQEREQRIESKNRNNSVEKNLKMWAEMRAGSESGQKCCVRAKIDMNSANGCMRDPTIYRCKNEPHPRTGTKYKVYPTYDFACPIVDSIEGVTHCLRTMEYHDRDEQFFWFIDALGLRKPHIWEYSRLNMMNTVLSKRKLTWFVDEGLVDGWDDPRFPTVRGVLRRGMTVEGLKQFIVAQGSSRSVVLMEWDKIWAFNKKVIDPVAPRYTSLSSDNVPVLVKNVTAQAVNVPKHPKTASVGEKTIWIGPRVLIDREDAETLKEGENATFINWGNLLVEKINRKDGNITSIEASPNIENQDYKKTVKLTWLAETDQAPFIPCVCVYFDHIISKSVLGKDEDFKDYVNKNTRKEVFMLGDPELLKVKKSDIIQLQRRGFFICDTEYAPPSLHCGRETPIVLFYIPDGRTKEMATSGAPKETPAVITPSKTPAKAASAASVRAASPAQAPQTASSGGDAASINQKIQAQGDLVRKLKSEKADKETVTKEVNVLLKLKADFKAVTGIDWKPGVQVPAASPVQAPQTAVSGGDAAGINQKIQALGDLIRKLKSEKADKETILKEVNVLLKLKADFKAITGIDWKPGVQLPAASPVQAPQTAVSGGDAAGINQKIQAQGDLVRKLKSEKADKETVTKEVNVLLKLKADFKAVTGIDWKPGVQLPTAPIAETAVKVVQEIKTEPVEQISPDCLHNKIVQQGDKVRLLKSQKAGKDVIDAEVKALLSFKADFKAATGVDWKPGMSVPSSAGDAKQSSDLVDSLNKKIVEQGDKVRNLKAQKASKDAIDAEVKTLLSLKAEFKQASGQEWKPNTATTNQAAPRSSPSKTQSVTNMAPTQKGLIGDIISQVSKLEDLKSKKASENVLATETKSLLNLKTEFKNITNQEWDSNADAAQSFSAIVAAQGDNVRQLKSAGSDTALIDEQVKKLLKLKADFKTLTGEDYAPAGSNAARSKTEKKKAAPQKPKEKPASATSAKKIEDKKQTRLGLEATKEENLPEWYSQVITKGELIEYYDVSGCYIYRPWSFAIWETIKDFFDREIKKLGVQNCYFPLFVSRSVLETEKTHVADFFPEVAWVTKSGDTDMAEPIAIRPTSETVMYPAYAKWVQSYRDLPIKLNQWNNVVRWEFKHPQPFLRTREFLWQEGHTAYASCDDAEKEVTTILDLYAQVYTDLLAIPVIKGRKTEKEQFAGGVYTTTVEAFISASGRAIQGATSHHLGQNFSKMFEITYEDPETKEKKFVYQNSWGITTRTIGVMIMIHADNQGLVLPPRVACIQVVIVPCGITVASTDEERTSLQSACTDLENEIKASGLRVFGDYRDNYSPGWRYNHWELKGVPIRVEYGPKDLAKQQIVAVRRDTGEKITFSRKSAVKDITNLLDTIQSALLERAQKELSSHTVLSTKWDEFCQKLDEKNIILSPFCGDVKCEEQIKKDSARNDDAEPGAPSMGAKGLCIPFEQPAAITPSNRCIYSSCKNKPKYYTLFGRSY